MTHFRAFYVIFMFQNTWKKPLRFGKSSEKKLDIGAGIKFEIKGAINLVQKYVINRLFIHFQHQGPAGLLGRVGCTKHITII